MIRYSKIKNKNKREIVLLKGYPCAWGKCSFCDYTADNCEDEMEMLKVNGEALSYVTGEFGALEVINSGSVFELPESTLHRIKETVKKQNISNLFFESCYSYKNKLDAMRDFFGIKIIYKCGIETFDDAFRNAVLNKGIYFDNIAEVSNYFDSVCLLVGVKGQTKEMIKRDIDILIRNFSYGCINLYINNTTAVKADEELQEWFRKEYAYLEEHPNIDVLWNNTDFGVGGEEE